MASKLGSETFSAASEATIVSRLHASSNEENEAAHEGASVSIAYDLPLTTTGKLACPALAMSPFNICVVRHAIGVRSSRWVRRWLPEACIANVPKASWLSA